MTANRLLPKANALNKLLNSDSASYKHTVSIYETCWHYYTYTKHRGKLCTFIRKNISTIKKNRDASIHLMHRSLHLIWTSWDFFRGGQVRTHQLCLCMLFQSMNLEVLNWLWYALLGKERTWYVSNKYKDTGTQTHIPFHVSSKLSSLPSCITTHGFLQFVTIWGSSIIQRNLLGIAESMFFFWGGGFITKPEIAEDRRGLEQFQQWPVCCFHLMHCQNPKIAVWKIQSKCMSYWNY